MAQNFASYHKKKFPINFDVIKSALEEFITHHCNLDNDFEIVWSLWLAKSLGISLSKEVAATLSSNNNSFVILTVLDLRDKGLFPQGLDVTNWEGLLRKENLYNEHWLVAYEVKKNGWIETTEDYLAQDSFFRILSENNVSFYKSEKELDLSKVRVTTDTAYLGDDEADIDTKEPDSVFTAVNPPRVILPPADNNDDLPF